MKVIVCLDDKLGMLFNKRRLSKDREVIKDIMDLVNGENLSMISYSYQMFAEVDYGNIVVDETFLLNNNGYCFVETDSLIDYKDAIDEIIIYWWNRHYPSDLKFGIDLKEYAKYESNEFIGYSHEKITREIYKKER